MTAAIIIIVCCWIISFFFNGIESGLLSIDPVRLRQNVKRRLPPALQLNRLLKQPERLLATVLLVTNAADIVALLGQRYGTDVTADVTEYLSDLARRELIRDV